MMNVSKTKNEMLSVIERLRQEKFPDLPADIVAQIIEIETDFTENQAEAYKRVGHIIEEYVAKEGSKNA